MSLTVFIAVILAAFLHAVWNAMVKKGDNKYVSLTAIVLGHVPISIIVIFFTPIFRTYGTTRKRYTIIIFKNNSISIYK